MTFIGGMPVIRQGLAGAHDSGYRLAAAVANKPRRITHIIDRTVQTTTQHGDGDGFTDSIRRSVSNYEIIPPKLTAIPVDITVRKFRTCQGMNDE